MNKFITWFKSTGISNVAYLGVGVASAIMGFCYIAGAAFGIFFYINWNTIYKLITGKRTVSDSDIDREAEKLAAEIVMAKPKKKRYYPKKK